jgi:hypothetical protein
MPARDPKQIIIATAEWMMFLSVTTATPPPMTPTASRKKRTLEMSRAVGSRSKVRALVSPARRGPGPILAQRQNALRSGVRLS